MSSVTQDQKDLIVRMITNTLQYVLVKWTSNERLEVVKFNSCNSLFPSNSIYLKDVCGHQDLAKLATHYDEISEVPTEISFSIRIDQDQVSMYGSSQVVSNEKISIWIKMPEVFRPIQYLQDAVHDMKAPINAIIGLSNLMQHEIEKEGKKEEMKTFLDLIKTNANTSVGLLNEVMELAEMESANYKLDTELVDLGEFLEVYFNTHRLLTLKKKITVNFTKQPGKIVELNTMKMTRVMDNVISNSVKFSPHRSGIFVSMESQGDFEVVAIKDEGIGMSKAIRSQLFVKFGTSKRRGLDGENSNGLGMSIIKQILELHGGNVEVESEEGKGTTVILKLKRITE